MFNNNDTIVFAGDSITDMGKVKPYGEESGLGIGLGDGYVHMFSDMMTATYPELNLRILNSGIGGNTSAQLLARWQKDVIDFEPNLVFVCIGVNDAVNKFLYPCRADMQVSHEEYRSNLEEMVRSAKGKAADLVFISPYLAEQNREDPLRLEMDIYREICRETAEKFACRFVDIQAMFDRYFKIKHQCCIAWDRIHPNRIGAYLIAREILKAFGFDYNHGA